MGAVSRFGQLHDQTRWQFSGAVRRAGVYGNGYPHGHSYPHGNSNGHPHSHPYGDAHANSHADAGGSVNAQAEPAGQCAGQRYRANRSDAWLGAWRQRRGREMRGDRLLGRGSQFLQLGGSGQFRLRPAPGGRFSRLAGGRADGRD